MDQEIDLIDDAVRAGQITICPPMPAAGELKPRKKKKRRGERLRPCAHCAQPVRFLKGVWETDNKQQRGWHWVNANGSHHRCSDFRRTSTWSPSPAEDTRCAQPARPKKTAKAARVAAAKAQAPLQGKRDWQPGPGDFNGELPI